MKKAFTLVEVLAVIIILGIIALLVTPSVISLIKNAESDLDEGKKTLVIEQTKPYVEEEGFEKVNGRYYCVTYNELLESNHITNSFYDTLTEEQKKQQIKVTIIEGNYEYEVVDTCEPWVPLSIELTSDDKVNDWTGQNVTINVKTSEDSYNYCVGGDNCVPDVSSSSGVVLLNSSGGNQYVCASATRDTEKVTDCIGPFNIDMIPPSIDFEPLIVAVGTIVNEVKLKENVIVTDTLSSLSEEVVLTLEPTTVNTSVAGTFEVKYKATDKVGNIKEEMRTVIVGALPTVTFNPSNGTTWSNKNIPVNITVNTQENVVINDVKWCSTTSSTCTPSITASSSFIALLSTNSSSNKVCVEIDSNIKDNLKYCSGTYKIDKVVPQVIATNESIAISEKEDIDTETLFTVTYGISGGGTVSCSPANTLDLEPGNHTVTCTATGNNGLSGSGNVNIEVEYNYLYHPQVICDIYNQPLYDVTSDPVIYKVEDGLLWEQSGEWYEKSIKNVLTADVGVFVAADSGGTWSYKEVYVVTEDGKLWYESGGGWYQESITDVVYVDFEMSSELTSSGRYTPKYTYVVKKDGTLWYKSGSSWIQESITDVLNVDFEFSTELTPTGRYTPEYTYVVKKDGTLWYKSGSSWIQESITNVSNADFEFFTELTPTGRYTPEYTYVVKKDGTLWYKSGSSWIQVSGIDDISNVDFELSGNSVQVYVSKKDGTIEKIQ